MNAAPDLPTATLPTRWQGLIDANHGSLRGWMRQLLAQAEFLAGRHRAWTRLPDWPVRRLVFVCLGNINRSAFGAEVARSLGLPAVSIGLSTTTGHAATPLACAQAKRQGFDLAAHQATDLGDHVDQPGDLLLVMELRHAQRLVAQGFAHDSVHMLGHWARPMRWHLHDPHTLSPAYFSTCFTLIESAVRQLAASIPIERCAQEVLHAGASEL